MTTLAFVVCSQTYVLNVNYTYNLYTIRYHRDLTKRTRLKLGKKIELNSIRSLHQLVSHIKVSRVEFSRLETLVALTDSYRYWKSASDQHCRHVECKKVDQVPRKELTYTYIYIHLFVHVHTYLLISHQKRNNRFVP